MNLERKVAKSNFEKIKVKGNKGKPKGADKGKPKPPIGGEKKGGRC